MTIHKIFNSHDLDNKLFNDKMSLAKTIFFNALIFIKEYADKK